MVAHLIADEPWFTYFTDHDDGIERTDLQLALCELAKFTRPVGGHRHYEGDGCEEYADNEEALDERAAAESASASPDPECRASGHSFPTPWLFRDTCSRCGCVRLMRGNPSRFVYEYPDDPSVPAES